MIGISSLSKDKINSVVEDVFDKIALQFIGNLPRLKDKKLAVFSSEQNFGLSHLFVQAMRNKQPNSLEQDVLKGMLSSADGYIQSLKSKTTSNLTERIDGLVKEASIRNEKVDASLIQLAIKEEMGKARSHLMAIVESEATKLRNVGTLMDITRIASNLGDSDPTVFFVVIKDASTCKECIRLHTVDGVTPKLWKFSELKQGYHKRGENNPSAFGLHPHCRCTLTYLSKGFSFDSNGRLKYHSENHDEITKQRK